MKIEIELTESEYIDLVIQWVHDTDDCHPYIIAIMEKVIESAQREYNK